MEKEVQTRRVFAANRSASPRGINTTNGPIVIHPGETSREIVVAVPEIESAIASGFAFEVLGEGDPIRRSAPTIRRTKLGEEVAQLRATVADLEAKLAAASGDQVKSDPPKSDAPKKTALEVLAMADDKSISYNDFRLAAQALLGDDMPGKKVDIIAALEELATQ